MPGSSLSSSQGWLNQTAGIEPLSSATTALKTVVRPRVRRSDTFRTSPAITASCSPKRSTIRLSPTERW